MPPPPRSSSDGTVQVGLALLLSAILAMFRRIADDPVGFAAILISVVSLYVAVSQVKVAERTLSAQVWPSVQFGHGNFNVEKSERAVLLSLANGGIGPARIGDLRMSLDGRTVRGLQDLLILCCVGEGTEAERRDRLAAHFKNATEATPVLTSAPVGRVIKAGEEKNFASFGRSESLASLWRALDEARWRLKVEVCYCSVLDECWTIHSDADRPAPVPRCQPDEKFSYKE